jgi:hypothetical protein
LGIRRCEVDDIDILVIILLNKYQHPRGRSMAEMDEKPEDVESSSKNITPTISNDDSPYHTVEKEWAPIRANDAPPATIKASSLRTLSRTRSQNGYSCDDDADDSDPEAVVAGRPEKDPFEVGWDNGDNDPLSPRSKSKFSKWVIVLICSFASFCV